MMTAIGVVLVWHQVSSVKLRPHRTINRFSSSKCTNAVSDSFSGLAVVKRLRLEDRVKLLTPPLQKNEIYHFLHEKHRDLIPKVERVVREMQASGELERLRKQIIEKYLARPIGPIRGK
jgi:ABC-type amino acid transport substrate-binding protein